MSAMAVEAPLKSPSASPAPEPALAERPFQADVIYITKSEAAGDAFLDYLARNYNGFLRLESVPNQGDGMSQAYVYHYTLPKCTHALLAGLYQLVSGPDWFLWVDHEGLATPAMCAGMAPQ